MTGRECPWQVKGTACLVASAMVDVFVKAQKGMLSRKIAEYRRKAVVFQGEMMQ
jgi:hypothetical protein